MTGMKHMPTGAFSSVPMTISFSPFGQDIPAERLRPEPGQAGQIVSVNHDVVESDGHAGGMRGTLGRIPETRCSAADGSIAGGDLAAGPVAIARDGDDVVVGVVEGGAR